MLIILIKIENRFFNIKVLTCYIHEFLNTALFLHFSSIFINKWQNKIIWMSFKSAASFFALKQAPVRCDCTIKVQTHFVSLDAYSTGFYGNVYTRMKPNCACIFISTMINTGSKVCLHFVIMWYHWLCNSMCFLVKRVLDSFCMCARFF